MDVYKYILPTPHDIKGARAYLDWSQSDLAKRAGIGSKTLFNIEKEKYEPSKELLEKIQKVFLREGVIFLPEGGFKANQNTFRALEGKVGIKEFFDDMITTLRNKGGGVVSTSGLTEEVFLSEMEAMGILAYYRHTMNSIGNVTLRVFCAQGHEPPSYLESYVEAKIVPHELYMPFPCYVYYDKVGFLLLHAQRAFIIKDQHLADVYRYRYNLIWDHPDATIAPKESPHVWEKYLKDYEDSLNIPDRKKPR